MSTAVISGGGKCPGFAHAQTSLISADVAAAVSLDFIRRRLRTVIDNSTIALKLPRNNQVRLTLRPSTGDYGRIIICGQCSMRPRQRDVPDETRTLAGTWSPGWAVAVSIGSRAGWHSTGVIFTARPRSTRNSRFLWTTTVCPYTASRSVYLCVWTDQPCAKHTDICTNEPYQSSTVHNCWRCRVSVPSVSEVWFLGLGG